MLSFLRDHVNNERASFHMPGHKGSAFFERLGYGDQLARIVDHDITEIPGADDLRHPDGIIKAITDKYAAIYGSRRAFISVNGSSALIMAAIKTCVRQGHKLLAAADSHISVKNGISLAGAEAVYVKPQVLDPWSVEGGKGAGVLAAPGSLVNKGTEASPISDMAGHCCETFSLPGGLTADAVAKALDTDPDIDAVILPSPNYFGIVSDIKNIADEVHTRGKVLIVDQAHGAHLKMFAEAARTGNGLFADAGRTGGELCRDDGIKDRPDKALLPVPAEECGADVVIVSTHKTLASFTQTAVGNLFGDLVDPDEYEKNLLMLESTSPSYILMESLALNADIMEKHGGDLAMSWRADLDWFYENVKTIPAIRVLTREAVRRAADDPNGSGGQKNAADLDDSKIVIDFSGTGLTGEEAEEILIEKGIYPEFNSGTVVMFLTGIGNVRSDYEALLNALAEIAWTDTFTE